MPAYRAMPATGGTSRSSWSCRRSSASTSTSRTSAGGSRSRLLRGRARSCTRGRATLEARPTCRVISRRSWQGARRAGDGRPRRDRRVGARRRGKGDVDELGITGFCWGGRIVWLYAAHNPKLKAGVAWYGPVGATRCSRPTGRRSTSRRRSRRRCSASTAAPTRHPERDGREVFAALKAAGNAGDREYRRSTPTRRTLPRRLPAELPQGQGRGRLEAHARVVQAAPGLTFARAAQPGRAACGTPLSLMPPTRGTRPRLIKSCSCFVRATPSRTRFPVPGNSRSHAIR